MDFIQLAAARYSCRSYTGQPVSREDLDACAKAACLAPSARNSQPWRIILVDDPAVVANVREQTSDEELKLNLFTQKAMAFAVFVNERIPYTPVNRGKMKGDNYTKSDIGGAVACFCLEAAERGIGSCIIGSFSADGVKKLLGIPAEKGLDLIVALGHPADGKIPGKNRRPMEEVVFYNGYPG